MAQPVILDFDQSTGNVPGSVVIDLADWQDEIRYGCSMHAFARLGDLLDREITGPFSWEAVIFIM